MNEIKILGYKALEIKMRKCGEEEIKVIECISAGMFVDIVRALFKEFQELHYCTAADNGMEWFISDVDNRDQYRNMLHFAPGNAEETFGRRHDSIMVVLPYCYMQDIDWELFKSMVSNVRWEKFDTFRKKLFRSSVRLMTQVFGIEKEEVLGMY